MLHPRERRQALEQKFPHWEPLTIAGALDRAAATWPERPFVLTGDAFYTYAEMQAWSRRIAAGLIATGVEPGQHVALDMANYPAFVAAKFAIARAGAVTIPVNFLLRGAELAYVLQQSDAVHLITMDRFRDHDYLADLDRIAPGWRNGPNSTLPRLAQITVYPAQDAPAPAGLSLSDLEARATPESIQELARREQAADALGLSDIIYTSGTTGKPKGVMLTHDMVLRAAYSSVYTCAFEDGRRIQFALPMYHVFGYVECMIAVMFVGGAIIPHAVFDPAEMLDTAERLATNELVCVPLMTHKLIELARTRGFNAPHFQVMFNSGGVNVASVWEDIRAVLRPREILTGYGMSETTASTTCTMPELDDSFLTSSNGRMKPAHVAGDPDLGNLVAQYKVIDPESGADLPPDTIGELVARGPIVTRGYYNKPEETADAFTPDGWLHTGDLGTLSADGYLRLTGRIKESYRCGGEMVMPREIEELFADHPQIEQALVVGVPDPKMGEVGCLCVVPSRAGRPDPDALLAFCAERLARFKVPRHVIFLTSADIPLTPTGRPQKFRLAELAKTRLSA